MTWKEYDEIGARMKREARERLEQKRAGWVKFCVERGKNPGEAFLPRECER